MRSDILVRPSSVTNFSLSLFFFSNHSIFSELDFLTVGASFNATTPLTGEVWRHGFFPVGAGRARGGGWPAGEEEAG